MSGWKECTASVRVSQTKAVLKRLSFLNPLQCIINQNVDWLCPVMEKKAAPMQYLTSQEDKFSRIIKSNINSNIHFHIIFCFSYFI